MGLVTQVEDARDKVTNYEYDWTGQVTTEELPVVTDPDDGSQDRPTTTNTYDLLGRVETVSDGLGHTTVYTYEYWGRDVTATLPDVDGDGGQSASLVDWGYDSAGNLTAYAKPYGGTDLTGIVYYSYDEIGRPVPVDYDNDQDSGTEAIHAGAIYAAAGNLVKEVDLENNVTTYSYDSRNRLQHVVEPDPDGSDDPTTQQIENPLPSAQYHYRYDEFGNQVFSNDSGLLHMRYAGREWDADAGMYYNRARWYDPKIGRFASEAPIGLASGDTNLYRYVGNSPTNYTDPSGLEESGFTAENAEGTRITIQDTSTQPSPPSWNQMRAAFWGSRDEHLGKTRSEDPPIPVPVGPCAGPTPCFRGGTPVHTEAGLREIEGVLTGTRLWAFDHKRRRWDLTHVLATEAHEYAGPIVTVQAGDDVIEATPAHPFWVVTAESHATPHAAEIPETAAQPSTVNGRWVAAQHLGPGDVLLARDGRFVAVRRTETAEKKIRVYNLRVEGYESYAVGAAGVLVHNM